MSVHHRLRLLAFPMRTSMADAIRPDMRSPRFRRVPFMRDVAQDPGRTTAPRLAAPHVLPSTDENASAPAILSLSWLTPTPHMIAVYASPWSSPSTPQHSLPGGRYPYPGRTFTGWNSPASPGAPHLDCRAAKIDAIANDTGKVQPRACGELTGLPSMTMAERGSAPRVRGTAARQSR